eukprot:m51a1_g7540 hypothetical protein (331) ;mRNA; f:64579-66418
MSDAPVVVKTKFGDDIRRFTFARGSFDAFCSYVASLYPEKRLALSYVDDEGDVVRITHSDEFDEALRIAHTLSPQILRITITLSNSESADLDTSFLAKAVASPVASAAVQGSPSALVVRSLDEIQERIVQTIEQMEALSLVAQRSPKGAPCCLPPPQAQAQAQEEEAAPLPVQPLPVSVTCAQLSREIAQKCAVISQELPAYTSKLSSEISEQCRRLSEEMSQRCREVSSEVSSNETYSKTAAATHASCVALHSEVSSRCSSVAAETLEGWRAAAAAQAEGAEGSGAGEHQQELQKLSGQIEAKCRGLAQETTKICADISRDIVSLVMHI